jgi:DNA-binding CsgD family transcriptional regulator
MATHLSDAQVVAGKYIHTIAINGASASTDAVSLMTILEQAIGWDGFRLFGVDPATRLLNRVLAASPNDSGPRSAWLREIYLTGRAVEYADIQTMLRHNLQGVAYQARRELTWGLSPGVLDQVSEEEHRFWFHDSGTPAGGVLFSVLANEKMPVAVLQAYRRDPGNPFRERDAVFLRDVATPISSVLQRAELQARAEALLEENSAPSSGVKGVVLLDKSGDVTFSSPSVREFVELLGCRGVLNEGQFAPAIWSAIRTVSSSTRTRSPVNLEIPTGNLRMEATTADEHGSIALIISHLQANKAVSLPKSWDLTARQQEVVMLVLTGATNRQLADLLFVSENTIEWHLRQIFERLDVRSKSQLQAKYFRESLLDQMVEPEPFIQ